MIRLCLLALALLAGLGAASAETRRALVIGNDRYANIESLQKARNDARAIAERLEGLGFEVDRLLDADRRETSRALARFAARLREGDTAFLFFAGHGVEIDGENYLLPVDIPAPDPSEEFLVKSEGIALSEALGEIRATGARLTLAVIDACRNNPFPQRGTRSLGREMGLAMNRPPEGTFIIYSAGAEQTALDRLSDNDPDPNSVFTRAFLELMERPGLDIRRFAVELRRKVTRLASTVGHPQRPGYYDEVLGDFAFLPGRPEPAVPAPPPGPKVDIVVDASGRGDHRTIAAAVRAARPGDVIGIREGRYSGGVDIDKPLELVGLGDRAKTVWEAEDDDVIYWTAPRGRIANLTLRLTGGNFYTVDFTEGGTALLEESDLTSRGLAIVSIRNGADPTLRGNTIRDGKEAGIFVYDSGKGRIEGNEIFGNAYAGIQIGTSGDPLVSGNTIRDGKQGGILVYDSGKGRIEGNEIFGNALAGIEIKEGSDPLVSGNTIRDGTHAGILVYDSGKGRIEGNEIFGNALVGIAIRGGGDPLVRGNVIGRNEHWAVFVYDGGRGRIFDNDLRGNARGAFRIDDSAGPVERRGNRE